MSWRKYFNPVQAHGYSASPLSLTRQSAGPARLNYSSFLPDVYVGSPNRIERYDQYNIMDMDSEVNAALDILAEFCTQKNDVNNTHFEIVFNKQWTTSEMKILREYLQQWYKIQKFDTRIFKILRNTFKYGDTFFIRDPETLKLYWVDPANVTRIIVNESQGKEPEQYVIRDFNINFKDLVATEPYDTSGNIQSGRTPAASYSLSSGRGYLTGSYPQQAGSRFNMQQNETAIKSEHVIHLSMSEGLDVNYPFGNSLLETIFKVFKQKELLEDAVIIYRVHRAPERRVFYVDVGNMPPHMAMQFVERVKTEMHQRRIPSTTGGGQNLIDSSYNPMSMNEDFFFPQTCLSLDTLIPLMDGRVLTLQEIINEYENDKTNWVYGLCNKTFALEPAKIEWAGVTRKNTETLTIYLSNNEKVVSTFDHKFILRDGSEIQAQDLKINDSLMPLEKNEYISLIDREYVTVQKIEKSDILIDTGDITISNESNSHWFGINSGIFIHNSEGRGSKVETLPGGSSLGEIEDLRYFTNKLVRGLRIPSSYLPTGAEDSNTSYNDGRVGTAYIQELRFNTYCERLQSLLIEVFDQEFKYYITKKGVNIDTSMFNLKFQPPQNFASYRQTELDNSRVSTYGQMSAIPYISNRFALKRFLGLTEEEIAENERLWKEENVGGQPQIAASTELRGAGISDVGMQSDLGGLDLGAEDAGLDLGDEGMPGEEAEGAASPLGGAGGPSAQTPGAPNV